MDFTTSKKTYLYKYGENMSGGRFPNFEVISTRSAENGITPQVSRVYVNSKLVTERMAIEPLYDKDAGESTGDSVYLIYFDAQEQCTLTVTNPGGVTILHTITYTAQNTDETSTLKRIDKMLDDDTSYMLLRANPKLTGNVKVVVGSNEQMYLDTFKISLALSQYKYRHIPLNPDEYYGRTLMSKMKSLTSNDFYKIEDACYQLFDTANDFNEQYYDVYNYGVRTNTDKMYKENFALLAPLKISKHLPDFFLVFRINDYDSLVSKETDTELYECNFRKFIDMNNCQMIKCYDMREGSPIGKYIRNIYKHRSNIVGDMFTGYDYDHANIFNGISIDRGIVTSAYEDTTQERLINNQVSLNDWYTLGFQRNRLVSKDIINFEFMFDDTSQDLFSIHTYFGIYVKMNGEDETYSCIDCINGVNYFDTNVHGGDFDPSEHPHVIYGFSTPDGFTRLDNNVNTSDLVTQYKLRPGNTLISTKASYITEFNKRVSFASVKFNDVIEIGEHYRIIDTQKKKIYEVFASNFLKDDELSEVSIHYVTIDNEEYEIQSIAMLNSIYRSNVTGDKSEILKDQLSLLVKAFDHFNESDITAYTNGVDQFSIVYNRYTNGMDLLFEKVSSICGYDENNHEIINRIYNDEYSYIFGIKDLPKLIVDNDTTSPIGQLLYPYGFEGLGLRACYCAAFIGITTEDEKHMILVKDDVDVTSGKHKTVIYKEKGKDNYHVFEKLIKVKTYDSINSNTEYYCDPVFSITGFGYEYNNLVQFATTPEIYSNGNFHIYKNYQINSGVCSIIPIKDFMKDVIDPQSVFKNGNSTDFYIPTHDSSIDSSFGEYYDMGIRTTKEEDITDYVDKLQITKKFANMPLDASGNISLTSSWNYARYINAINNGGHTKFDVELIAPYCCKWRKLATDWEGNRLRVMYQLVPENSSSYNIANDSSILIGFISSSQPNSDKHIKNYYDKDETYAFYDYIYNNNGNIDDLMYYYDGDTKITNNRFSKVYAYGENSIELVSSGAKIRLESTNKTVLNLSKYIGYSGVIVCMSGNNPRNSGLYELFVDEIKEQLAIFVYNGKDSDKMNDNPSDYNRIITTTPLNELKRDPDYPSSIYVMVNTLTQIPTSAEDSSIYLISKPIRSSETIATDNCAIIYGRIEKVYDTEISVQVKEMLLNGEWRNIEISDLTTYTNNVDCYIDSSIAGRTAEQRLITITPLSLQQLKENNTCSFTIKRKVANDIKTITDSGKSILNIKFIDSVLFQKENVDYKIVESGNVHPCYAVPVMNNIISFDDSYENISMLNNAFDTDFLFTNIIPNESSTINQTWLKKILEQHSYLNMYMMEVDSLNYYNPETHQHWYGDCEVPYPGIPYDYTAENGEVYTFYLYENFDDESFSMYSENASAYLPEKGILIPKMKPIDADDGVFVVCFKSAMKYNVTTNSVTLFKHQNPFVSYWYSKLCRLFTKSDQYSEYFGTYSGYDKNCYFASSGLNLKGIYKDGTPVQSVTLSSWSDSIHDTINRNVTLNVTNTLASLIKTSHGFSNSTIGIDQDIRYTNFEQKYIENAILPKIEINNNNKFILYVDESSISFSFLDNEPNDFDKFTVVPNFKNSLTYKNNKYYMDITGLDRHRYYAKMIINL